jgi:hypothetical protein
MTFLHQKNASVWLSGLGQVILLRDTEKMVHPEIGLACQQQLLRLINDPDEEVRKEVGRCFVSLRPEHFEPLRGVIEAFIGSYALLEGSEYLATVRPKRWSP